MELTLKQKVRLIFHWFLQNRDCVNLFAICSVCFAITSVTWSLTIGFLSFGTIYSICQAWKTITNFTKESKKKIDEFPQRLEEAKYSMQRIKELVVEMKELAEVMKKDEEESK